MNPPTWIYRRYTSNEISSLPPGQNHEPSQEHPDSRSASFGWDTAAVNHHRRLPLWTRPFAGQLIRRSKIMWTQIGPPAKRNVRPGM